MLKVFGFWFKLKRTLAEISVDNVPTANLKPYCHSTCLNRLRKPFVGKDFLDLLGRPGLVFWIWRRHWLDVVQWVDANAWERQ